MPQAVSNLMPAGSILPFSGTVVPAGYMLCDGSSLSRTVYAKLFAVISTVHGTASGSTFNIPDYRGRFLRGVDAGSGRDPDSGSRTQMNSGGASGNTLGTVQGHMFASHSHSVGLISQRLDHFAGNTDVRPGSGYDSGAAGGSETRPINAYCQYIIKI